jgi:hypothetical protein
MDRLIVAPAMIAVAMLVPGFLGTTAAPALAECTSLDRWRSFITEVTSAKSVFVGTVVESPDASAGPGGFRFETEDVFRGNVPQTIVFGVMRPYEVLACADSYLKVRFGDRLAFAYDSRIPDFQRPPLAVAALDGTRLSRFFMPGIERLTTAQVRDLAGLPPTDTTAAYVLLSGPDRWLPRPGYLLDAGDLQWVFTGEAVAKVPASARLTVTVRSLANCEIVARFSAESGQGYEVAFGASGQARVESARGFADGPLLLPSEAERCGGLPPTESAAPRSYDQAGLFSPLVLGSAFVIGGWLTLRRRSRRLAGGSV